MPRWMILVKLRKVTKICKHKNPSHEGFGLFTTGTAFVLVNLSAIFIAIFLPRIGLIKLYATTDFVVISINSL